MGFWIKAVFFEATIILLSEYFLASPPKFPSKANDVIFFFFAAFNT